MLGPVCDDLVHEGQRLDGCSLHHVDYDAAHHSLQLLPVRQLVGDPAADGASQRVPNDHHVLLGEALQQLLEGLDGLAAQRLDRVVVSHVLLLGKAVALEVVGQQRAELLDLSGQGGEAECGQPSAVDAEEHDALGARPEDRSALDQQISTSAR